ncbi:MAG: hypothetical protein KAT77_01030 [Nanoarchaeota archaeon]|nr:hypothetical protein [Nanoarchaeota archaeon]
MLRESVLIALLGIGLGCPKQEPLTLEGRIKYSEKLCNQGKLEESAQQLEIALKQEYSLPILHTLITLCGAIGDKNFEEEKYQEAVIWYCKAAELIPKEDEKDKKKAAVIYFHLGASYWWLFKEYNDKHNQNPQKEYLTKKNEYFKKTILNLLEALELDPGCIPAKEYLEKVRVK